ncbi:sensor histidine kinase [Aestuariibacter sp. A3R04]|uniref:sensor histidine kinase n=1 Tax=Aestuariibacter sp. A3R04 TaxID=2841571 RepID=UPI001C09B9B7|nr:ATP-binding protein [Aestuariibacter sp. A3R04]MBU3021166.1 histidine kinase [Aestuariibacter sp. A3R04]
MFEQLVGKLPVGICVVNEQYEVVFLNDFFVDRMDANLRKDYQDKNVTDIFPAQAKFLRRRIKSVFVLQHPSFSYWEQRPHIFPFNSSRPITGEETQMFQNMEIVPLSSSTHGKLACIFLQDVTAQASYYIAQQELSKALKREHEEQLKLIKKLDSAQSQLIQAEKMASTGQLAAGIAHEINNPIGFVSANLDTLRQYGEHLISIGEKLASHSPDADTTTHKLIQQLLEAHHFDLLREDMPPLIAESCEGLTRVRDIVENLKRFALEESSGWQLLNLEDAINQMLELVAIQYKNPVYKAQIEPKGLKLFCEPGGIKQALMNIVINAAQSVTGEGFVKIIAKQDDTATYIKVLDNGSGIDARHIKKIFDPFFTTKPEGLGQGLGLSVAYTAIEKHNGRISVNSKLGKGTVFDISLPLQQPEDSDELVVTSA